jgi:hypothetical protein
VTDGFLVKELAASDNDGSILRIGGAEAATVGAGLLGAEVLGLPLRGLFEGASGEPSGGGNGNALHGVQVDVQTWAVVAEGAADNDFSPLLGQSLDFRQILVVEFACRHSLTSLRLATFRGRHFPFAIL